MAEDKKSFILYSDQKSTIDLLSDEQAGKLLKHIYAYVSDENPTIEDIVIKLAFEPIKQQLKRDLRKYEKRKEDISDAGFLGNLKRWHFDLYQQFENKELNLDECKLIVIDRKVSQPDSNQSRTIANVAVNVNDNVNDIKQTPTKVEKIDFDILLKFICDTTERQYRTINNKVRQSYNARIKEGYTKVDIMNAIKNACKNQFHLDNGRQYLTPEFFSRSATLEKFASVAKPVAQFDPNANPVN